MIIRGKMRKDEEVEKINKMGILQDFTLIHNRYYILWKNFNEELNNIGYIKAK